MPASCKDIRAALAQCLQSSDCVLIHRNTPSDCLRPPLSDTLPTQCLQLKHGYGQCKRGQIDMRKRFRGNKPVSVSTELEAGGGRETVGTGESAAASAAQKGGMLYAGRGAYDEPAGAKGGAGKGPKEGDEWERYVRNDGIEDLRRKG